MYFLSVNRVKPDAEREKLAGVIPEHIRWIRDRISEGKIVQAGKWGKIGGMSVIIADDIAGAVNILNEDPLVKSGLSTFEIDEFFPAVQMHERFSETD
jgi:uncharacterized protein YciI